MSIKPNKSQQKFLEDGAEWWKQGKYSQQVYELSGAAGTGKTTILLYFLDMNNIPLDKVLFVAYVGQAALVMRLKGLDGRTIHSTIYEPVEEVQRDEHGEIIIKNGRPVTKLSWELVDELAKDAVLIVADEGSMIPPKIGRHLESFGIPMLVVGDLNQLEPVFGEPYYLKNPDSILTELMRQDDESGILDIIDLILNDKELKVGKYKRSAIITEDMVTDEMLLNASVVLCGKNKTREKLNKRIRKLKGNEGKLPQMGDKLICRRNNWRREVDGIPLVNGLRGELANPIELSTFNVNQKTFNMDFKPDFLDDNYFRDLKVDFTYLNMPCGTKNNYKSFGYSNKFEFGEAITTHLSQGSEYPSVLVFEEVLNYKTHWKQLYTAISRAQYMVILVLRKTPYRSKSVW